jgi:hypothetical protein
MRDRLGNNNRGMNMTRTNSVSIALATSLLLVASIAASDAQGMLMGVDKASHPTCANPIGDWKNDFSSQSTLSIKTFDSATGAITGFYASPSGAGTTQYPLVGWVNSAQVDPNDPCKQCKSNNKVSISWVVRWGSIGSITAWAGTCGVPKGESSERIIAQWNLTRPNSGYDWDHVLAGQDRFTP